VNATLSALASLPTPVLVGLGGALGALGRYAADVALSGGRRSTFAVNVLGSFALGALLAASPPEPTLALAGTGFCGAFTTFSSFAVNVSEALAEGEFSLAAGDAVSTLVAALVGVSTGMALVGL
jgi:CrcB protein